MNTTEELLLTITEKLHDVYEAGKASGGGGDDGWQDVFWEVMQFNGQRTKYNYPFTGYGSTGTQGMTLTLDDFKFYPKYSFENVTDISYLAQKVYGLTSVGELIMPNCTNCNFAFDNCYDLENVDALIAPNATNTSSLLNYCKKLKRVGRIDISSRTIATGHIVYQCYALEEIYFEGVINNSLSFQWCPLNHASLMSIINALKDYSEDTSGTTYTLTLAADNLAKLTDAEKAIATGKGWTLA